MRLPQARIPQMPSVDIVSAKTALEAVKGGRGRFVDLRSSAEYRKAHAKGAVWAIRPHLDRLAPQAGTAYYLIGEESARTRLAAGDLVQLYNSDAALVDGGMEALVAAGAETAASPNTPAPEEAVDFTWFAHGRHDGDLDASRLYLDWEQGLVEQLDAEERAAFLI
jgi:rhodanese-related sulfurtransferase